MEGNLVGEPETENNGEGGSKPILSYSEKFEELCGYYLSLGMTYDEYWEGDPEMTKHYREKYRCEMDQKNTELWLMGVYIYEALMDVAPLINLFDKHRKAIPYRTEPYPLTKRDNSKRQDREEKQKMQNGLDVMSAWMISANAKFKKKQQEQTDGSEIRNS